MRHFIIYFRCLSNSAYQKAVKICIYSTAVKVQASKTAPGAAPS